MTSLIDAVLVGSVLCAACAYAIYSLGPRPLRTRVASGVAALLRRLPLPGLRRVAGRIATAAANSGGACGGCDNCGSEPSAASPDIMPEVKIPLSQIGRRR